MLVEWLVMPGFEGSCRGGGVAGLKVAGLQSATSSSQGVLRLSAASVDQVNIPNTTLDVKCRRKRVVMLRDAKGID